MSTAMTALMPLSNDFVENMPPDTRGFLSAGSTMVRLRAYRPVRSNALPRQSNRAFPMPSPRLRQSSCCQDSHRTDVGVFAQSGSSGFQQENCRGR
jgi:hypothetical protein